MLGISVYFKDLDYEYVKKAHELGAKYIFTSLHIKEENLDHLNDTLPEFIKYINTLGIELIPDISPVTFEKLNIDNNDYQSIYDLGFRTIRLDYGFDDFEVVRDLQSLFTLVLNASIVNESYIIEAKQKGIDFENIYVMHNFYPKTYTGLSCRYFRTMNEAFLKHNIKIIAFVPGDLLKRFPLYEGLPTLEHHRNMNPFLATLDLMQNYGVHDVMIGDSYAKYLTLEQISKYMKEKVLLIPIVLSSEYEHLYDVELRNRKDQSDIVIRILSERLETLPILENNVRPKGTLTIENALASRYCGEIQLTRQDLPASASSNVIGYISTEFVDIVDYIDASTIIKFIR